MPGSLHHLHHLIARYGYAVVALFVGAEGVGLPLPGETALLTAAALAARGHLSIVGVIVAASIGVVIGGSLGYWIGQTAGQVVVVRYGKWIGVTPARLEQTQQFFARSGSCPSCESWRASWQASPTCRSRDSRYTTRSPESCGR